MKPIIKYIPEVYIIGLCVYWALDSYSAGHINYTMLIIIGSVGLQSIFQNRVVGLLLGGTLTLLSLYMILAVLSDYHKFESGFSKEALTTLAFGGSIFGMALLMSVAMVCKFALAQAETIRNKVVFQE